MLVAVVLLRPLWVFPAIYLPRRFAVIRRGDPSPPWQYPAAIAWAGMRGVVTLAAVFVIPQDVRHREVLVLAALTVVAGTLLLQGSTLPWLVRRLRLRGPDAAEDALAEAQVLQSATRAGVRVLNELAEQEAAAGRDVPETVVELLRTRSAERTNVAWERLGRPEADVSTPSQVYRRLRLAMLTAERAEVLALRDAGTVADEVLQHVLQTLDVEESMLDRAIERADVVAVSAAEAMNQRAAGDAERASQGAAGGAERTNRRAQVAQVEPTSAHASCEHLESARSSVQPSTPGVCQECVLEHLEWVHLRMCLACGHVGCCDSSVGQHAGRHFTASQHPVVRSVEPSEVWRWCYADELLG